MENLNETRPETAAREFVISRVFDAPRNLVFKAWTEAEQLEQWWGPKGLSLKVAKLEMRPGGMFHYCIGLPDGQSMWGRFIYSSIVEPERLVYINSFSDETGEIIRAPFSQEWPLEIHNTLTLTEQDGKTTLTQRSQPIHATAEERKTFEQALDALHKGCTGTFDQLEDYLAKLKVQA
ncbi:SRPBCC family protein [Pontibacter ruber]|uniref:SRPBCC domain-containing protein n=1 Tax=Pontibacter ruber TaxID=1343895 RepID=A0ABW5CYH9_9BACT|nr:SRPBCC domain-containing protein [Pontibacter ruber]